MRHGQSEANIQGIIVSSPGAGTTSFGLTAVGREQAAQSIRASGIAPDIIYSSDFKRARETAEIVRDEILLSRGISPPLQPTPLLRERFFGDYDGLADSNYEKVWAKDARQEAPGLNVELPSSVLTRCLELLNQFKHEAHGTVLLVAHGDVCQILLAHAAGLDPSAHRSLPHMKTAEIRELAL